MNFAQMLLSGPMIQTKAANNRGSQIIAQNTYLDALGNSVRNTLEIAEQINVDKKTAASYLGVLEKRHLVERVGTTWLGKGRTVICWKKVGV